MANRFYQHVYVYVSRSAMQQSHLVSRTGAFLALLLQLIMSIAFMLTGEQQYVYGSSCDEIMFYAASSFYMHTRWMAVWRIKEKIITTTIMLITYARV